MDLFRDGCVEALFDPCGCDRVIVDEVFDWSSEVFRGVKREVLVFF